MIKKLIFLIIVLVLSSFMVSSVQTVIPGINRTVFYDPDGAGYVKGINREEINYNCLTCSANTSSINISDYDIGFVKYENNTQNIDVGGFNITNVGSVSNDVGRGFKVCDNGNIIIGDLNLSGVYC